MSSTNYYHIIAIIQSVICACKSKLSRKLLSRWKAMNMSISRLNSIASSFTWIIKVAAAIAAIERYRPHWSSSLLKDWITISINITSRCITNNSMLWRIRINKKHGTFTKKISWSQRHASIRAAMLFIIRIRASPVKLLPIGSERINTV